MNFYKCFATHILLIWGIISAPMGAFALNSTENVHPKIDTFGFLEINLKIMMEGAYDLNSSMRNDLLTLNLLPNIQPYQPAPWNYNGVEGDGWTNTDYPPNAVDWVKVSFRATLAKNTQIAVTAGVLLADGTIFFPDKEVLQFLYSGLYIYVQHRNHLAVLSPQKVIPQNGKITFDFTTQNSYTDGYGQKEIEPGVWAMIAADGDQLSDIASDINGKDNAGWVLENGAFNIYNSYDYNMDGDINGADRTLWSINNGYFSSILK